MSNCLNCGSETNGNYCSNCGQESSTNRFGVKNIAKDIVSEKLYSKSKHFRTFGQLITRPGPFISEYINGKRVSYTKPFAYFLFLLGIYIIAFNFFSDDFINYTIANADIQTRESVSELEHFAVKNINYSSFLLPLIFAYVYKLLIGKRANVNYAEAFVFSMYIFGTELVIGIIWIFVSAFFDFGLLQFRPILSLTYLIYAVVSFSKVRFVTGIVMPVLTVIISYLLLIGLVLGFTYTFLKIKGVV